MTKPFNVIWSHSAVETDLAQIVVKAMEHGYPVADINRAMVDIDRLLSKRPDQEGESRSGHDRVLVLLPLAVVYQAYDDERIVYISEVHYSPRSS